MSTNLLEAMATAFSEEIVDQASPFLGESESGTESALGMLLLVLSAGALKGEHRIWTKSQNLRPENRLNPA